jgi:hypothetical protein
VVGKEDACPWGRPAVPLCKCCGQPGANSSSDLLCVIAYAGNPQIAHPRLQVQTRSSLTMSSASVVAVEKSGPDFHRLALPSHPKSNIRSIPKSGSGAIPLLFRQLQR